MEAPKKVYLLFNRPYLVDYAKLNKRRCEEEVEYTRADTFIEKACEFLRNNIDKQLTIYHEQTWCKRDEFIKKFCKYMKGE